MIRYVSEELMAFVVTFSATLPCLTKKLKKTWHLLIC